MTEREKLFELILLLDDVSTRFDSISSAETYEILRKKHYENMEYIRDEGLMKEYYDYFHANYIAKKEGRDGL